MDNLDIKKILEALGRQKDSNIVDELQAPRQESMADILKRKLGQQVEPDQISEELPEEITEDAIKSPDMTREPAMVEDYPGLDADSRSEMLRKTQERKYDKLNEVDEEYKDVESKQNSARLLALQDIIKKFGK